MLGEESPTYGNGLIGDFDIKSHEEIEVSLIYGNKGNPYVAFSLSVSRKRGVPKIYYSVNGPLDRLVMDFRFMADTFTMEYHHLSAAEIERLSKKVDTSRAKGRITAVKLALHPGEKPELLCYRWAGKLGIADEGAFYTALDRLLERGEFEVLTFSAADSNLRAIARAFALKGFKLPMTEWRDVWGIKR